MRVDLLRRGGRSPPAGSDLRTNASAVFAPRLRTLGNEQNAQAEDQVGRQEALQGDGQRRVKSAQAGKRHGMIKRTAKFVRQARGTTVLSDADAIIIKKNFLPYADRAIGSIPFKEE